MPTTEGKIVNNLLNPIGAEVDKIQEKIRTLQNKNSLSLCLFENQLRDKWIHLSQRDFMTSSDSGERIVSLGFAPEDEIVVKRIIKQRVTEYLLFATKMPKPQLLSKLRPLGDVLRLNSTNQSPSSLNVLLTYCIVARIGNVLRGNLPRLTINELLRLLKVYQHNSSFEFIFSLYYFIHSHEHLNQHQLGVFNWKCNAEKEIQQTLLMRYAEVKWYTSRVFLLSAFLGLVLSCDMNLNYFPVSSVSSLTADQLKQVVLFHGGLAVFIQLFIHASHLNLKRLGVCHAWFNSHDLLNLPLCLLYFTLSFAILELNEGAVGPLNQWLNPQAGSLSGAAGVMAFICTLLDVGALRLLLNVLPAFMANGLSLLFLLKTAPWTWDQSALFGENLSNDCAAHSFMTVGKMGLLQLVPLSIFYCVDRDRVEKTAFLRGHKARLSHPGLSFNKKEGEDHVINRLEQACQFISH